jgi:hypothetical protein
VNKFTPFGDIRIRQEGFYNQGKSSVDGSTRVHARNRTRFRWRLGLKYAYSDELAATSGSRAAIPTIPSRPTKPRGKFLAQEREPRLGVHDDHAGQELQHATRPPDAQRGKFPNPMFRVGELVFDDDLSPEGFNETVALLDKPCGALDQVKLHAQQWTFEETANAQDGWMFGGQVNPTGHIGNVLLEGGVGQYWWLETDSIAQAAELELDSSGPHHELAQHRGQRRRRHGHHRLHRWLQPDEPDARGDRAGRDRDDAAQGVRRLRLQLGGARRRLARIP